MGFFITTWNGTFALELSDIDTDIGSQSMGFGVYMNGRLECIRS